ncbi:PRC-barrel domain-containing protein [Ammoniphilus resinae]|uniref:Uncharacterized protein YrrD n=1 Tax=Ammoniphilus resinae TaxID=861532 RepID=A0ABS4GJZ2_9BACL|nr:uncharacterized protein YrrD [Ammoniphilus resinae]
MYKANDVIGLPVIDLQKGQELGIVRDVLFDQGWTFQGLLVEVKTFFRRGRFIPSDSIHAIGGDCVTVSDSESLQWISGFEHLNGLKNGQKTLLEKSVITPDGSILGHVEDIYFQEELASPGDISSEREYSSIVGFEISDGFLTDLKEGRKTIKPLQQVNIGEDAIVIPIFEEEESTTKGENTK